MSSLLKNLLTALCIAILLSVVYYFTIGGSDSEFDEVVQSDTEVARETAKILSDTQKIDTYDLDVSIFTDKRFLSLKDFTVKFDDVSTGRPNPFAPVQ